MEEISTDQYLRNDALAMAVECHKNKGSSVYHSEILFTADLFLKWLRGEV